MTASAAGVNDSASFTAPRGGRALTPLGGWNAQGNCRERAVCRAAPSSETAERASVSRLLLAACTAALATSAAAGPPDPQVPSAIRAEIERGANAALDCYLRFPALTKSADFAGCVQETHADNRQRMGTGYEAFDAGLYFRAAQYIRIKIEVLQDGDPTNSNLPTLTSLLGPLEAGSDAADAALHISYDAVRAILTIE